MRLTIHNSFRPLNCMAAVISMALCLSCSTGIEGTKKIRMTKEDIRLMVKSPEQTFSESIQGSPLSAWEMGKQFLGMSDRTLYIFEPTGMNAEDPYQSLKGKTLYYTGLDSYVNPDLREECVILFSDGQRTLRYRTGKSTSDSMKEIDSSKLPLIADINLIDKWKEKITGMTLWTKSNLWYDISGNRLPGLKFAKVKVEEVVPSTGDFPISIRISGPDGKQGYLHMNYTSDLHDSRNFAAILNLSDPKEKYPYISDEHWMLIQQGKVGQGMTKEECKLAIGNPDEVRSGHNRAQTMDIWQYSDGTYLMFSDGLLTNFRQ